MNKAILVGNVGGDPEVSYTGSGTAVAKFSLATEESWIDGNGERQKKTMWHKIEVWAKRAEFAQKHIFKGQKLCVEGSIEYQEHEGKWYTKIKAHNLEPQTWRDTGANGGPQTSYDQAKTEAAGEKVMSGPGASTQQKDVPF